MAEAVGCGAKCAKYVLIVFNFIFWLSGAALLAIGIWILVDKNIAETLKIFGQLASDGKLMQYAAYVLIGVGAFIFIVGFCGCCGAIRLSKILLIIYIICLFIIMGAEIAGGVLAYVKKDAILDEVKITGKKAIVGYGSGTEEANATDAMVNSIQQGFDCCGIIAPGDWAGSYYYTDKAKKNVPFSCCMKKADTKTLFWERTVTDVEECSSATSPWSAPTSNFYNMNCIEGLTDWATEKSTILIGVGVGIACLEIFGFIFAICLCRNIDDDDE